MKSMYKKRFAAVMAIFVLVSCLCAATQATEKVVGMDEYRKTVLNVCNDERAAKGLNALALDEELCNIAEKLTLEQKGYLKNNRPNGTEWTTLVDESGYAYAGGLLGRTIFTDTKNKSAQAFVDTAMKNNAAKANLLNPEFTHTGLYVHYFIDEKVFYFIQIFAKPEKGVATSGPYQALVNKPCIFYTGPGTKYKKIGKGFDALEVSVASINKNGWAKLYWKNKTYAYTPAENLTKQTATNIKPVAGKQNASLINAVTAYAGPNEVYGQAGSFNKGQRVYVSMLYNGKKAPSAWAAIAQNEKLLFVRTENLLFDGGLNAIPKSVLKTDAGPYGMAKLKRAASIYVGTGTKYGKLDELEKGMEVSVYALHEWWAEIVYLNEDFHAYVHTDNLKF